MALFSVNPGRYRRSSGGAALLLTLFLVAVLGVLLTVAGKVWRTETQRAREADLLWIGNQYANALAAYYMASPSQTREYPRSLRELLLDSRHPNMVRHLRRLYADPMSVGSEWGLIRTADGRIVGVHSLSEGKPLKQGGFDKANEQFAGAASYSAWKFIASTGQPTPPSMAANAAAGAIPTPADDPVQ